MARKRRPNQPQPTSETKSQPTLLKPTSLHLHRKRKRTLRANCLILSQNLLPKKKSPNLLSLRKWQSLQRKCPPVRSLCLEAKTQPIRSQRGQGLLGAWVVSRLQASARRRHKLRSEQGQARQLWAQSQPQRQPSSLVFSTLGLPRQRSQQRRAKPLATLPTSSVSLPTATTSKSNTRMTLTKTSKHQNQQDLSHRPPTQGKLSQLLRNCLHLPNLVRSRLIVTLRRITKTTSSESQKPFLSNLIRSTKPLTYLLFL